VFQKNQYNYQELGLPIPCTNPRKGKAPLPVRRSSQSGEGCVVRQVIAPSRLPDLAQPNPYRLSRIARN
jgi:hypothetical protein